MGVVVWMGKDVVAGVVMIVDGVYLFSYIFILGILFVETRLPINTFNDPFWTKAYSYKTYHQRCRFIKGFSRSGVIMMTSSNGNFFRVAGHLCRGIHRSRRPVTRSFNVFFDLRLNKRLSKQSWGWWFEMTSRPLWRHCIVIKDTHLTPMIYLLRAI